MWLTGRLWRYVHVRDCSHWSGLAAGQSPRRNRALCGHCCHRRRPGWTPVWLCEGSVSMASPAATPGSRWSGSSSDHWSQRGTEVEIKNGIYSSFIFFSKNENAGNKTDNRNPREVSMKNQLLITIIFTVSHVASAQPRQHCTLIVLTQVDLW